MSYRHTKPSLGSRTAGISLLSKLLPSLSSTDFSYGRLLDDLEFVNVVPGHSWRRNQPVASADDSKNPEFITRNWRQTLDTAKISNDQPEESEKSDALIALIQILLVYCFIDTETRRIRRRRTRVVACFRVQE
jgi:hypothetical protein